jgi:hypothetical protein
MSLWITLWNESLIHGHFVTAFTATLSHKPIVKNPYRFSDSCRGGSVENAARFPTARSADNDLIFYLQRKDTTPMTDDELMTAFLATNEMADLDNLIEDVREAVRAGKPEITLKTETLSRFIDDIAVGRLNFTFYQESWNKFCDQQGRPDQKIAQEQGDAIPDGDGPF